MARQALQSDAEKLEAAMAACRQLIAEAHGVLKDLRTEAKIAREFVKDMAEGVVAEEVAKQIDALGDSIDKAMERGTQAVYDRFDKLADIMTGDEVASKQPTIGEMMFARDIINWIVENAEKDAVPADSTVDITPIERGIMERLQTNPHKTRLQYLGELPPGAQPGLMINPSAKVPLLEVINPDAREDKPA